MYSCIKIFYGSSLALQEGVVDLFFEEDFKGEAIRRIISQVFLFAFGFILK
jgi:hypothetical protein